jgi:hypothetical protein
VSAARIERRQAPADTAAWAARTAIVDPADRILGQMVGNDHAGSGEQRREHADHDAVDVQERQDQPAAVARSQLACLASRIGHGFDVGVVEHLTRTAGSRTRRGSTA